MKRIRLTLPSPYVGLRPFFEREALLFFGRDPHVRDLLAKLAQRQRFLAVLGASGTGKSSLVRAGLIPALHRGALPPRDTAAPEASVIDRWNSCIFTPGDAPLAQLAHALTADERWRDGADRSQAEAALAADLGASPLALSKLYRQKAALFEREALLLVCIALGALGEPFAVQAFSGYGPQSVSVRTLKRFDEAYGNPVATRIAALEPEHYTRAGAAIRHASATLMQEPAAQRLLLLLSDGKPNDVDVYEGRYGVEDTRRAVIEAKLQGIAPFCLTVDRHAAAYLPGVFGAKQYALLATPANLPAVLLDWIQRLVLAA